jgi:hypothetical protein
LPDGTYFAWGIFGQYVIVIPKFNAVLAVTGGMAQMISPGGLNSEVQHLIA